MTFDPILALQILWAFLGGTASVVLPFAACAIFAQITHRWL
jgi:hypothetical protein